MTLKTYVIEFLGGAIVPWPFASDIGLNLQPFTGNDKASRQIIKRIQQTQIREYLIKTNQLVFLMS